MDNSIVIYVIMYISVICIMIIFSYTYFLNFYDDTNNLYINYISNKIIDYIKLIDMDKNKLLKKLHNEIKYIDDKLFESIKTTNNKNNNENINTIRDIYDYPFVFIFCIIVLIIFALFLNNEKTCNVNNQIKTIDNKIILGNILLSVGIMLIFLTVINSVYLYYVHKNIIKVDIKDILIDVLTQLKKK